MDQKRGAGSRIGVRVVTVLGGIFSALVVELTTLDRSDQLGISSADLIAIK